MVSLNQTNAIGGACTLCAFFKPKITVPAVTPPAQAATPISELPTPEPAVLGGSDQKNTDLGAGNNKKDKVGKSSLKIELAPAPKTSTTTGANLWLNTKR